MDEARLNKDTLYNISLDVDRQVIESESWQAWGYDLVVATNILWTIAEKLGCSRQP